MDRESDAQAGEAAGAVTPPAVGVDAAGGAEAPAQDALTQELESNAGTYRVRYTLRERAEHPLNEAYAIEVELVSWPERMDPQDVELRFDAAMPEHLHGLVRRATVERVGTNGFVVENVLLHMPGRWELYFDLGHGGMWERAQDEVVLE